MNRRWLALGLAALAMAGSHAAPAQVARPVPGTPLFSHEIRDNLGRTITYYASRAARPTPILLMIQGSGCSTVMRSAGSSSYSTLFDLLPFAAEEKYTVVAVEKPFADSSAQGGTAEKCSAAFNRDFTAERWLVALQAVLDSVRRQPNVDKRRTVVLGASEGAVMASLLAGRDATITDAIIVSGSGTTQLFDFLALAYQQCFDRGPCLADVERQARAIQEDPASSTRFAWGHPFRRWSSFFKIDAGEELVRSRARIYLALGTADTAVPPLSQEIAVAKLLAAGHKIEVRRVAGGDHGLMMPGSGFEALDREYRKALQWIEASP